VFDEAGMRVSIGVGPNKLIAKLAVEYAKPRPGSGATGVHVVRDDGVAAFMAALPLAAIPGIGPVLQEKLARVGLAHVRDVLAAQPADLARWLGRDTAHRVLRKARGESAAPVEPRAPAKQVSREETFDRDLSDVAALHHELRTLADRAASDLRGDKLAARTVTVKVKDKTFTSRTAGHTMTEPIESGTAIAAVALSLLAKLRAGWTAPVRLLGVALSNFAPARDAEQLTIFGAAPTVESPRDRALSRAMDRVREKYGDGSISAGVPRTAPLGEKGARKPR